MFLSIGTGCQFADNLVHGGADATPQVAAPVTGGMQAMQQNMAAIPRGEAVAIRRREREDRRRGAVRGRAAAMQARLVNRDPRRRGAVKPAAPAMGGAMAAAPGPVGPGQSWMLADVVEQVKPTVVSIGSMETVNGLLHFQNTGSGLIVDPRGFVLTSHHAISGRVSPKVVVFGADNMHEFDARVIADDPVYNIAVLKIDSQNPFPSANLGSPRPVRAGTWVFGIGSPDGHSHHATPGMVSSTNYSLRVGKRNVRGLMQTNMRNVAPGSLGGPLIDAQGNVVGMHLAQNIGLPINQAVFLLLAAVPKEAGADRPTPVPGRWVAQAGQVVAWIGAEVLPMDKILATQLNTPTGGILVNRVLPGSPSEAAGLQRGDVIRRFNRRRVNTVAGLDKVVGRTQAGRSVPIDIIRAGRRKTLDLKVAAMPGSAIRTQQEAFWFGITLANLTPNVARKNAVDPGQEGVLVAKIPARVTADTGLLQGDVIRAVNGTPVANINEFNLVAGDGNRSAAQQGFVLDVVRRGRPHFITLEPTL
ncbi:MAG: hypothetical protein COB53_10870 [Elusimicrobia bacterium]|nr:MAG: hypothetical protein COB53_10870 [Elusimicrobiota bacterium]